jgi:hypothetical protein
VPAFQPILGKWKNIAKAKEEENNPFAEDVLILASIASGT